MIYQDGVVVATPPDQLGIIVETTVGIIVLNRVTVNEDFDMGSFRVGQKVRVYLSDDGTKILSSVSLS